MRTLAFLLAVALAASPADAALGPIAYSTTQPYASFTTLDAVANTDASNFVGLMHATSPGVASSGAIGANQAGFQNVSYQRNAVYLSELGILQSNTTYLSQAWSAWSYGWAQQLGSGDFNCPQCAGNTAADIESTAFFLAQFVKCYFVMQASSYWTTTDPATSVTFQAEYKTALPKLLTALDFLQSVESTSPYNIPAGGLIASDLNNTNRLFFDAGAFQLGGQLLNTTASSGSTPYCGTTLGDGTCPLTYGGVSSDSITVGINFVNYGLANQNTAGWFGEAGPSGPTQGPDSSYNATSMLNLEELIINAANQGSYTNAPIPALTKSGNWELSRVLPNGAVSWSKNTRTAPGLEVDPNGSPKTLNYFEMPAALIYWGVMLNGTPAVTIGNNIGNYSLYHGCNAPPITMAQAFSSFAVTVPQGCTHLRALAVGEGGSGGNGSTGSGGAAGGTGAYAGSELAVTPGNSIFVTIGAGGTATKTTVEITNGTCSTTSNCIEADFGTSASGATAGTGGLVANSIGTETGAGKAGRAGVASAGGVGGSTITETGGQTSSSNYGGGGGAGVAGGGVSPSGLNGGTGGTGFNAAGGGTGGTGSATGAGGAGSSPAAYSGAGGGGGGLTEGASQTAGAGAAGASYNAIDGSVNMVGGAGGGGGGASAGTGAVGGAGAPCGASGGGGGFGSVAGGLGGAGAPGCVYGEWLY